MADTVAEQQQQQKQSQPELQPPPPPQTSTTRPKVKSYLHKFYDRSGAVKDPALYEEEDEMRRLLNSGLRAKQRGCHLRPIVWKAMLWIGVNCLIFGALGLAIAFFLPHEPELIEVRGTQGFVRNQTNAEWNRSANILKYVALGIFGIGALVTAAGLVLPSLVWRLFDEDDGTTGGGHPTDSCCSSGASVSKAAGLAAAHRRRQKPPGLRGTTAATASTAVASFTETAAAATAAETPALSSLVDERPVQPPRGAEGHVSHGQVK